MNQSQTSELQGQRKKLTGAQKREHEVVRNGQRFHEGGLGYFVDKTKTPKRAEIERGEEFVKDFSEIEVQQHWTV